MTGNRGTSFITFNGEKEPLSGQASHRTTALRLAKCTGLYCRIKGPGFEIWLGSLSCVLGHTQETLFWLYSSPPRCINGYQRTTLCWGWPWDRQASHPGDWSRTTPDHDHLMLQEPGKFPAVLDYLARCKPFPAIFTGTEKRHFTLSKFCAFSNLCFFFARFISNGHRNTNWSRPVKKVCLSRKLVTTTQSMKLW